MLDVCVFLHVLFVAWEDSSLKCVQGDVNPAASLSSLIVETCNKFDACT